MPKGEGYIYLLAAGLLWGPFLVGRGVKKFKLKRTLDNIPTSKVRSASLGAIELKGQAVPFAETVAPLSQIPCCWWSYVIHEERRGRKGRRSWVTIANVCSSNPVYLKDDTGQVLVDPAEAEIHAQERVFDCSHQANIVESLGTGTRRIVGRRPHERTGILGQRFKGLIGLRLRATEILILSGTPLYVLGELASNQQYQEDRKIKFQEFLRRAKADPKTMAQADLNRDGKVDLAEWENLKVRLEAEFVRQCEVQKSLPDRTIVRKPEAKEIPFVVGVQSQGEDSIKAKLGWQSFGMILAGIVANGATVVYLLPRYYQGTMEMRVLLWAAGAAIGISAGMWLNSSGRKKQKNPAV